jgi:hypothetical protein
MDPTTKYEIIQFLGNNMYLLIIVVGMSMFKTTIESAVSGLSFWMSREFNEDEIVYINGRKARITKIGFRNTVFFMYKTNSKIIMPNGRLKYQVLEKLLPNGINNKDRNDEN